MRPPGNYLPLNLGPLFPGPTSHLPLNLGVDWDDDGPDPPDPPDPVIRGLRKAVSVAWQGRMPRTLSVLRTGWSGAPQLRHTARFSWRTAGRIGRASAIAWSDAPRARREAAFRWSGHMASLQRDSLLPWAQLPAARRGVGIRWQQQETLHGRTLSVQWRSPPTARRTGTFPWRGVLPRETRTLRSPWLHPGPTRVQKWILWGVARRVPWLVLPPRPRPPDPPEPTPWPDGRYIGLNLGCAVLGIPGFAPLNLGVNACYAVRPQQRTYVVTNEVTVVRLPDRAPIEVTDLGITGDVGSVDYALEMALADPAQLELLQPTAGGPRRVEVSINGYLWTFVIETFSRVREFGARGVRVSGRSTTVLLDAPYAPARTKVSQVERSAAQLVDEELADTGYTATFETVDWLVPPGAWFYEATPPLEAIGRIADAAGAVVQSDPAEPAIRIRPRYPVSPWDWPDTTPDHVLQDDLVVIEQLQVRSAPMYDAVVVTGELQDKGVTATIRRAGEGGQLFAPQASSPLINTAAVATERGRNVLSDRGEQASIDHTLPLFPAPLQPGTVGRVLPLDLVEVQAGDGTWQGLCSAVRIDARVDNNVAVVEQTITLERHYSDAN